MKKPLSIRSRLILWLVLPLTIISICIFVYFFMSLEKKIDTFFDKRLYVTAKSIEENIGIKNDKLFVDFSNFYIDFLSSKDEGVAYYSIENENGDILIGHGGLLLKDKIEDKTEVFYDLIYDGFDLRAVSYKAVLVSAGKKYVAFITIAQSKEERNGYIKDAFVFMSTIVVAIYLLVVSIILLTLNFGLLPLNTLKKVIHQRDKYDLQPLKFNAPKELETVVDIINILLDRSRENIKYMERFNSDISHQLRTPIAELKVKLELLYEKDNKDFILLNSLLEKMSHLTSQLLLYAKSHTNLSDSKHFKTICLNDFCKSYSKKVAPRVFKGGFEYEFEDIDEEIYIKADTILLESMLDNLIDNSLKYAVNNSSKPSIVLDLKRYNNSIWLSVRDNGKGLDRKHQNHIFDRYYRADLQTHGSGLGLSIVKQIAFLHEGKVLALNEDGLKISIIFNIPKAD